MKVAAARWEGEKWPITDDTYWGGDYLEMKVKVVTILPKKRHQEHFAKIINNPLGGGERNG